MALGASAVILSLVNPKFIFLSGVLLVSGCCSARIELTPKGRDAGVVTSGSSTSDCCLKKAREEAQTYCEKKGGYLSVLSEKTVYLKSAVPRKSMNATVSPEVATQTTFDSNVDYQTTLNFRCR